MGRRTQAAAPVLWDNQLMVMVMGARTALASSHGKGRRINGRRGDSSFLLGEQIGKESKGEEIYTSHTSDFLRPLSSAMPVR